MMSMKGDGKPVSFIEDCAVPLDDLADYTDRLTRIFEKHGTYGTWYAHASVGCLHVRPVLNLKQELEVKKMRAIAEEAFAMVREYKGSHSGEHGDGLVRSEFHEAMFGARIVRAFEEVKDAFDPQGLFNPGKIVRAAEDGRPQPVPLQAGLPTQLPIDTALDWSEWGGFAGAAEMCNNNGACRKPDAGVMCPSYRATGDEQHLTRGRANTLRLALSGQLGPEALASDAMRETMALCVSCKGCKRECPTGVDMARMKIEFLHHYRKQPRADAARPADRLSAALRALCRAPRAADEPAEPRARFSLSLGERLDSGSAPAANCRPGQPPVSRRVIRGAGSDGRAPRRYLQPLFRAGECACRRACAAARRLSRRSPRSARRSPALLRPHLPSAGLVEEARREARRMLDALAPHVAAGTPIVGLEPSCLLTLRDEFPALLPGAETKALAERAPSCSRNSSPARARPAASDCRSASMEGRTALLHGHCHQKAFDTVGAAVKALQLIPGLDVETFDSTCCGMAGSFGYEAEHYEMSLRIGELGVLPKMRAAPPDTMLAANGTSCRHQIADAARREARHLVRILDDASAGA